MERPTENTPESQAPQRGMCIKTNDYKEMVLCIHPETLKKYLDTIQANPEGWVRFAIREKAPERIKGNSRIRHGLQYIHEPTHYRNPLKTLETK